MKSSVDTNIILRYLWKDVDAQVKKVRKLFLDSEQILYVSDLVLAEVIFNLQSKGVARTNILEAIRALSEIPNLEISDFVMETVLPFYAEHPALSFVDCYAAFEAEKKGWEPLYTFDRKLANQHPSAKMA